jgi:hypothetical protein
MCCSTIHSSRKETAAWHRHVDIPDPEPRKRGANACQISKVIAYHKLLVGLEDLEARLLELMAVAAVLLRKNERSHRCTRVEKGAENILADRF